MPAPFIKCIDSIYKVSDALKQRLENDLEIVELPKRTLILQEGQRSNYIAFVLSGLLRAYYMKDGEEVCSRSHPFFYPKKFFLNIKSIYLHKISE